MDNLEALTMCSQSGFHGADQPPADRLLDLEAHIRFVLGGRLREFELTVRDTGLVLRGQAQSYYVKQLAQQAVMDVVPIPILANEIEVS